MASSSSKKSTELTESAATKPTESDLAKGLNAAAESDSHEESGSSEKTNSSAPEQKQEQEQKVEQITTAASAPAKDEKPAATQDSPATPEKPAATQDSLATTEKLVAMQDSPATTEKLVAMQDSPATTEKLVAMQDSPATTDGTKPKAVKPAPDIDVPMELEKLSSELSETSFKTTSKLVTVDNLLNRYRKLIAVDNLALLAKVATMRNSLDKKLADNAEYQSGLKASTTVLLEKLDKALQEGQSLAALPAWDRIQGNINNTNGDIRQHLQALANPFKPKIIELRDWKIFAATEKKQEIIGQMEKLAESRMNPGDKSKHITRLHKDWKALGRSNQNEELWQLFKECSDRAYQPCSEYFKQRKQQMAQNLKARRELCDQLEAVIQKQAETDDAPKITDYNKLVKEAEDAWKKHAPVEQSKIRSLQKRFYACINTLRKQRKAILRTHAAAKCTLIEQATALTDLEDRSQAMQDAKRLQQQWKKIGPTSFKEDKKYWEKFRAACDKIFESRNHDKQQRGFKTQDLEKNLKDQLLGLQKVLELPEEELRKARNDYQDLTQGFTSALEAMDKRQRRQYLEKFNGIKRKIDNRLRTLPDKKSQALLQVLNKATHYLQEIEQEIQTAAADGFAEVKNKFSPQDWQSIDKGSDKRLFECLEQRAVSIQDSSELADFLGHCDKTMDSARRLCIETEIRCGIDSPANDQALRMELQLGQLQKGLGQARYTTKENLKFAQQARLLLLCMGPMPATAREEFQKRLEESSKRLF